MEARRVDGFERCASRVFGGRPSTFVACQGSESVSEGPLLGVAARLYEKTRNKSKGFRCLCLFWIGGHVCLEYSAIRCEILCMIMSDLFNS